MNWIIQMNVYYYDKQMELIKQNLLTLTLFFWGIKLMFIMPCHWINSWKLKIKKSRRINLQEHRPSAWESPDPPLTVCHDRPLQYHTGFFVPPPFSPSVSASQPPYSRYPSHTSPPAKTAPTGRQIFIRIKKRQDWTVSNTPGRTSGASAFICFPLLDGLHHFGAPRAPMPETTQKRRIFPSRAWEGLAKRPQSNLATSMSTGYIRSSRSCWLDN